MAPSHVAGGSHDVGRHVTESHAEAPGEAAGRPPPTGAALARPSAHVTGGRGAAHVTGAAGRRVLSVPAPPQLPGPSSRWTRPPAGPAARATAAPRPRLRRAMAAPGARRPLLLLLLGEPGREGGGREGRAGSASRDGREGGVGPGGNGAPGAAGERRVGLEPAGRPAPQWRSPPRSPCGPQDADAALGAQPVTPRRPGRSRDGGQCCWHPGYLVRGVGAAARGPLPEVPSLTAVPQ